MGLSGRLPKNSKEDSKTENSFIDTQVEWSKYQVSKSILEQLSVAICEKEKLELNEYTLIYYFRGDCSACIASFINWYKEFNGYFLNSKVSYMFVNFGKELDLLLYYIDEADLQFRHCLYHDNQQQLFNTSITEIEEYKPHILLLNKEGELLAYGDPFYSEYIYSIYSNYNILTSQ